MGTEFDLGGYMDPEELQRLLDEMGSPDGGINDGKLLEDGKRDKGKGFDSGVV